jgi:hypothetical protein
LAQFFSSFFYKMLLEKIQGGGVEKEKDYSYNKLFGK